MAHETREAAATAVSLALAKAANSASEVLGYVASTGVDGTGWVARIPRG
jgi:hypothetical protein